MDLASEFVIRQRRLYTSALTSCGDREKDAVKMDCDVVGRRSWPSRSSRSHRPAFLLIQVHCSSANRRKARMILCGKKDFITRVSDLLPRPSL